jgi:gamma-glutamylcyclotransferase (GGCT)/AIG2-like uncharacterized protein YtfP
MDKKWLARLLITLVATLPVVQAEELFPDYIDTRNARLSLCSRAELKAFRLIHVGNAALYLDDCRKIGNIFSTDPKHLRFLYEKAIPAKAFKEASEEYLKINLGQNYTAWRPAYDKFNSHYQDIKEGDYYDLIYDPETGLRLNLNNKPLAVLNDPAQSLAYLNIWFGKEPFSDELKEALLNIMEK